MSEKDRDSARRPAQRQAAGELAARKTIDTLEQFLLPERAERFRRVVSERTDSLTVVLDGVRNFHNISAVLRSADAFGLSRVHLVGERFEFNRGIAKGSERWLDAARHTTPEEAISSLHRDRFKIVVLQPDGKPDKGLESVPVFELPFEQRLALVFGNELRGVSEQFVEAAEYFAHIPMCGFVESFNISVAASITLFCSGLVGAKAVRRTARLSIADQEQLLAVWLSEDIRGAEAILTHVDLQKQEVKTRRRERLEKRGRQKDL